MPLFPQLSTTQMIHKIKYLGSHRVPGSCEMTASVVDWLAVNAVVEDMFGPADAGAVSAAALFYCRARLFLDNVPLQVECIGASLAWVLWFGYLRKQRKRFLLLAWLSVGALILRGLVPFQFMPVRKVFPGSPSRLPCLTSMLYPQSYFSKSASSMELPSGCFEKAATGTSQELLEWQLFWALSKRLNSTSRAGRRNHRSPAGVDDGGALIFCRSA